MAGRPLVGWPLIGVAALLICSWFTGRTDWWWGLLSAAFAIRTFSAMSALRRYNAWLVEWQAMGGTDSAPVVTTNRRGTKLAFLIPLGFITILWLASVSAVQDSPALLNTLRAAFVLLALYGGFRLLRRILQGARKTLGKVKEPAAKEALDEPIQLAVSGTKDSPTRADAERNLPDYCLPLMARK
jgi:hypothetical protein